MRTRIVLAAVLLAALAGWVAPALAETYWSPSTGRMTRCDPSELPASPADWQKVDPCKHQVEWEQRSRLKPGALPTIKSEAELAADVAARTATGALYAGLDLEARLAAAVAFKARLHAAGKSEAAVDAEIARLGAEMDKVLAALK